MRRTRRAAPKRLARRVSWSRRIGVAAAFVLLVGGSLAFAGQALDDGAGRAARPASAPPPPPLTVLAPGDHITRRASIDLTAVRPLGLRQDQAYVVLVYVNGELVRERELSAAGTGETFVLAKVPLVQGSNAILASLVGDSGEGARSAPVTIVRDDVAPAIHVSQPTADEPIYADSTMLRGRTELGATLTITNLASGEEIESTVDREGRFVAQVPLAMGDNMLLLRSADPAGNLASARVTIIRSESAALLALTISATEIVSEDLPTRVIIGALVRDEVGNLVDGAEVTFSVSPPDSATRTHRVVTVDGLARWDDLTLDPTDAPGVWLVTALATLPSGLELREDGSFSLE